jgi:hypothetical protein
VKNLFSLILVYSFLVFCLYAQKIPPAEWGAPPVKVIHTGNSWDITGGKHKIIFREKDFSMTVDDGVVLWKIDPSVKGDLVVKSGGRLRKLRLADAGKINVEKYSTGYKTGIKVRLGAWRDIDGSRLDPVVIMTIALEGDAEELVCDVMVVEDRDAVKQLDWPGPLDASAVDYTLIPTARGNLIPRHWPKYYHPFKYVPGLGEDNITGDTTSIIQANHIECWSMSWWGFKQGNSSMILIVETPDDAGYQFEHPAGGPTVIGPRWYASLGHFRYPRSVRMDFIKNGNYVTLAKRYRKYVQDIGQFVSLKEKIARQPKVARLIGAAHLRPYAMLQARTFTAIPALSYDMYKSQHKRPAGDQGVSVMTFEQLAAQLRELKSFGIDNIHVVMCGWTTGGYDMGHPDPLPPAPEAGGWEGYKKYVETCHELGYTCVNDDQYRDYYRNAHSFDTQFAIHEEEPGGRPLVFPGTRFEKHWKEGRVAFMNYWAGGDNAYLDARFAVGHVVKNYNLIMKHGIKPDGIFFDVMGYVPPTEDFNPEHPLTRTECMKYRARMFNWARNNLGIVGTEDGADWVVPYVDYTSVGNEGACVPVPLYNLVYHDAIITQSGGFEDPVRCILNAGYVQIDAKFDLEVLKVVTTLQKRVGLLEMIDHEFLKDSYRKERTTFSDGTTITVDRDAGTWEIDPPLLIDGKERGKGVIKR